MANVYLTPKTIAQTGLALLKNRLVAGKFVNGEFTDEFKRVGDTISVKRPPQLTVRTGSVVAIQDVVEGETQVKIDTQLGVDVQASSLERSLYKVDDLLKNEVLDEAMARLAQDVDTRIHQEFYNFPSWVGTPGQTIDTQAEFSLAPKRLDNMSIARTRRIGMLSVDDYYGLNNSLVNLPTQRTEGEGALRRGEIVTNISGVDVSMSQSVVNLITGTRGATAAVNGAGQAVAYTAVKSNFQQTLIVDGLGAGATVSKGEVFTIAGVFAVNPGTRQTLPFLQQFTVLAAATADGAGAATLTIAMPIITTGAYQTVSGAPADNAVITWMGAASTIYPQNLVLRPEAITLASAKMVMPAKGSEAAYATDPDTGLSIRYWRFSDGANDLHTTRWDVLFGIKTVDPRQGTRVSGTA